MSLPVRLNQRSTFLTLYHLSDHVFCTCSMLHDTVHTQEENAGLDIVLPMLKRIRKTKVPDIYKECDLFNTWTTFCSPFGYNTRPYTGIVLEQSQIHQNTEPKKDVFQFSKIQSNNPAQPTFASIVYFGHLNQHQILLVTRSARGTIRNILSQ